VEDVGTSNTNLNPNAALSCMLVSPYVHIAVKIDYLEVHSKPLSSIDMYPTTVHNKLDYLQMSNTISILLCLKVYKIALTLTKVPISFN
jgi:hypothetical protein